MKPTPNVTAAPAVKGYRLFKSYQKRTALRGLSLIVPQGVLFGLVGPDGAGKSTLLKIMAGILTYDAGELHILGHPVASESAAERIKEKLCFMPQGLGVSLYQELSVEENLEFFGKLRLLPPKVLDQRKEELLNITGLAPFRDRRAKNLSGGMKQKLALICSLIHEPELIILDEPTTGVDPLSREDFWALLASLVNQKRVTALVSTTYLEEAQRFDQVALVHEGQILAQGEPKELLRLVEGQAFSLATEEPLGVLHRLLAEGLRPFPYAGGLRVFVPGRKAPEKIRKALAGLAVTISPTPVELPDVVLALSAPKGDMPSRLAPLRGNFLADEETETVIWAREITRDFNGFRAVDQVTLTVKRGEIYGLLGPNGAGKTTLIRMLCGLLPPTGGEGRVAGYEMRTAPRYIKEHIGYLSQAFSLYQDLTVRENLWLMAGIYGLSRRETRDRTQELLSLTGLLPYQDYRSGELPLGLRQRLALACAIVHRPKIVFLDEPTSGVDVAGRQVFWTLIYRLSRETGLTCLVTTHYLAEAEYCDRLTLMHQGRVVAQGPPKQLKAFVEDQLGHPWILTVGNPWAARKVLEEKLPVSMVGRRLRFFFKGEKQEVEEFLRTQGIAPLSLIQEQVTMEDVFLHYVKRTSDAT